MANGQNPPDKIDEQGIIVWYQALLNRYNSISNANNAIDSKTSVLLAAAVAILVFGTERISSNIGVIGAAGIIGLITACSAMLKNISLVEVASEVNGATDKPEYYWMKNETFLMHLMADLGGAPGQKGSLEKIIDLNQRKGKWYKISAIIFVVSGILLFIATFWDISLAVEIIKRS